MDSTGAVPRTLLHDELLDVARRAAAALGDGWGDAGAAERDAWISRTAEVLAANLASGRLEDAARWRARGRANGHDGEPDLVVYAQQVLVELRAESERIARLTGGDAECWQAVLTRMQHLAYYRLSRAGPAAWARQEAQEVAAYACAQLWDWLERHPYPFDVPFDRWSALWLNHRLSELARREQTHERHVGDSLDSPLPQAEDLTLQDVLPDRSFDQWLENAANREALEQAIGQLPPMLATVTRLWYLEQWYADEIAAYLCREVNYVYVLRFRAIQKLRQVALDVRFGLTNALALLGAEQRRLRVPAADQASDAQGGRL